MVQLLRTEILTSVNPEYFNLDSCSNDCPIGYFLEFYLDFLMNCMIPIMIIL